LFLYLEWPRAALPAVTDIFHRRPGGEACIVIEPNLPNRHWLQLRDLAGR